MNLRKTKTAEIKWLYFIFIFVLKGISDIIILLYLINKFINYIIMNKL